VVNSERERNLGKATGDILKAIRALETESAVALSSEIAARTGTSRAFVTKMLKSMAEQGLVDYSPYRGVRLTEKGMKNATELVRHHRLLERFLTDTLGFALNGAHEEAERLEHVISEELEARLAAFLGYPTICPHGSPIPNSDGTLPLLDEANCPLCLGK
jgi:DtxR family transcriptional regulator, Mn-dependent transcriptional regulator